MTEGLAAAHINFPAGFAVGLGRAVFCILFVIRQFCHLKHKQGCVGRGKKLRIRIRKGVNINCLYTVKIPQTIDPSMANYISANNTNSRGKKIPKPQSLEILTF